MSVIQACADTSLDSDKLDALQIAIEFNNKRLDEGIAATSVIYILLSRMLRKVEQCSYVSLKYSEIDLSLTHLFKGLPPSFLVHQKSILSCHQRVESLCPSLLES